MRRIALVLAVLAALLGLAWFAVTWSEATKEVRILCGQFRLGVERADVIRQLDTGHFLRYVVETDTSTEGAETITFDSRYNLRTTHCTVHLQDDRVIAARYRD